MGTKIVPPVVLFNKYHFEEFYLLGYNAVQSVERMGWYGLD
jgi:hypothetical protein